MPKLRTQVKQQMSPREAAIEYLCRTAEELTRERQAYQLACQMDAAGNYLGADDVLRAAGVSPAVVQQRRQHINWRLDHGYPAIGDGVSA